MADAGLGWEGYDVSLGLLGMEGGLGEGEEGKDEPEDMVMGVV